MKEFLAGFKRGVKLGCLTLGCLAVFFLTIYVLTLLGKYINQNFGVIGATIFVILEMALGCGIVEGLWVRNQYKKLEKELELAEDRGDITEAYYIEKKMNQLLNGNYHNFVR